MVFKPGASGAHSGLREVGVRCSCRQHKVVVGELQSRWPWRRACADTSMPTTSSISTSALGWWRRMVRMGCGDIRRRQARPAPPGKATAEKCDGCAGRAPSPPAAGRASPFAACMPAKPPPTITTRGLRAANSVVLVRLSIRACCARSLTWVPLRRNLRCGPLKVRMRIVASEVHRFIAGRTGPPTGSCFGRRSQRR